MVTHYTTVLKKTARLLTIVYSNDSFRTFPSWTGSLNQRVQHLCIFTVPHFEY